MIELLSALVANGTTVFNWGYKPWLPFYNFIPISFLVAGIFYLIIRDELLSVMYLVSEYSSLIPTYLMWSAWDLNPFEVLVVWVFNTGIIWFSQLWLLDYLARISRYELVRPYKEEEENTK